MPLLFSIKEDMGVKFSWYYKFSSLQKGYTQMGGGGTDTRTLSLEGLYQEHLAHRNKWTRSNEGYDMARYFGTVFTLHPHPNLDYIFWWNRNYDETDIERLDNMAPGKLLLYKHRLVLSRSHGGRRRHKIFVPPPTKITSQWFPMHTFCNVGLLQFGASFINLEDSFIHSMRTNYGVTIGYCQDTNNPYHQLPTPFWWGKAGVTGLFNNLTVYRWWWDTGEGNYLMINDKCIDPTLSDQQPPNPTHSFKIVDLKGQPYWSYFWGLCNIRTSAIPVTGINTVYSPGKNPWVYGLTWYRDVAQWIDSKNVGKQWRTNPRIRGPQDCSPPNQKVWVFLAPFSTNTSSGGRSGTGWRGTDGGEYPTGDEVKTILTYMTGTGPFALGPMDIPFGRQNVNIPLFYTSLWQWGSQTTMPNEIRDPCDTPTRQAQVRDPATTAQYLLKPEDLDHHGLITKTALQRLLFGLSPPTLTGVPAPSPEEAGAATPRRPEIEGWPVPETSEAISDSSGSSSETETEEDPEEFASGRAQESPRRLRHLLRRLRRDGRQSRQLKRLLYKLAT